MTLLLAILEALTLVILQHTMLGAMMSAAKATVADNGLRAILAVLEGAANFPRGHAAAQGQGHVQGRVWGDCVVGEGGGGRGEVFAGVDDAEVGGGGEVCA